MPAHGILPRTMRGARPVYTATLNAESGDTSAPSKVFAGFKPRAASLLSGWW